MILTGDCIEVMAGMEPDSVDAVVTDPPYGLEFMGKEWDAFGDRRQPGDPTFHKSGVGPYDRATVRYGAYSGKTLQALRAFGEWCETWGREALRVTKPGGYLLAFGGTRTHHRLVCGLEDAGWIIRDELDWIYASGFPKGKANLKPAHEPIVLARKPGPLRPLAIDECRIGTTGGGTNCPDFPEPCSGHNGDGRTWDTHHIIGEAGGRWPSNVLLSDPELFDSANPDVVGSGAVTTSGDLTRSYQRSNRSGWSGPMPEETDFLRDGDRGGYSRFFIVPKADRSDREPVLRGQLETAVWSDGREVAADYPSQRGKTSRENGHPTVKPTDLMRHLVRLVTPVGGTVLDCFLGSGSTAIAAEMEGFAWIGIEKEPEYVAIAEARLNGTQRGLGLDVTG